MLKERLRVAQIQVWDQSANFVEEGEAPAKVRLHSRSIRHTLILAPGARHATDWALFPRLQNVDDLEWASAVRDLSAASESVGILSRCLGVSGELTRWRAGNELDGLTASDALDQARGDLERLAGGGAQALVDLVVRIVSELPQPLE